jgi:hypothetical protein
MMHMKEFSLIFVILAVAPVCAQLGNTAQPEESEPEATVFNHPEDRMQTPPAITGLMAPKFFEAEGRVNYLRYGFAFTTAHSDNPTNDVSYSVAPTIAIHEATPRLYWDATYAPGFTFYQHTSSLNESDPNASLDFAYRLSPHVTISARDGLQKSSSILNQSNLGAASEVPGGAQVPNISVFTPLASRLTNSGNVDLSYQFALNQMIGVDGRVTTLHFPNPSQVPGLYDAQSQGTSIFYAVRVSSMHYFGVSYHYQRLLSYPTEATNETQTHGAVLFYTLYPNRHVTISAFAGPQHSDTLQSSATQTSVAPIRSWSPAAGASLSWEGRVNTLALSYSHVISDAGGLIGAVHMDSSAMSFSRQLTKTLSGSLGGAYVNNKLIGSYPGLGINGHSVYGTASVQKKLGQNVSVQVGYMRLHQTYGTVPLISRDPDMNREFVSISYQFSRPLGR